MARTHPSHGVKRVAARSINDGDLRTAILERLGSVLRGVEVRVERGDVYLKGSLGSATEGRYLTRVVAHMAGVGVVRADFRLRPQSTVTAASPLARHFTWSRFTGISVSILVVVAIGSFLTSRAPASLLLVPAPVTVRVDDHLAVGAFLTLHPLQTLRDSQGQDLSGLRPVGFVQANGLVRWTTWKQSDGIPPGQYVVTAIWQRPIRIEGETIPGPNSLSQHFSDPHQSPLRLRVDSDSGQVAPQSLDLNRRSLPLPSHL